ncbi:MAG: sigma-70 family RNA polymerase sigma factor [Deltaproteobacteria bacterium]|nr:sigma-70 family RNA polymerase sigma factor [Deltaproteobacteria bacterium]
MTTALFFPLRLESRGGTTVLGMTRDDSKTGSGDHVDAAKFTALVEANKSRVFRVVLRYLGDEDLAREITQAAFVQAYHKMSNFRGDSAFGTWIYRIAINLCKNRIRETRRLVGLDEVNDRGSLAHVGARPARPAHDLLEDEEERRRMTALVRELPEKQRATLELRVFGELSFDEIAAVLGCQAGTAKVNFHYAVRALRRAIARGDSGKGGAQ